MTAQAFAGPQTARRRAAASARFEPPRLPLLLMVLKGWALTVLTLGAYRFWALADYRAFMWRHLSLGGERMEYDGRPADSLIRFLIDSAVAVPVIVGALVGLHVMRDSDPLIRIGGVAGAVLVAGILMQARRYRVRQYLASHTLWRGVRGGMDGSPFAFAATAVAGWLAVIATLGLAYPWMRGRCWSYQISRARFGNRYFTFEPASGPPFGAWLIVWLSAMAVLIGFAGLNQAALLATLQAWREGVQPEPGPPLTLLPLAAMIVPAVFYLRYRVRELHFVAAATSIGRVDLVSSLPTVSMVVATLLHWILALVGAGLAFLWLYRSATEAAATLEPVGILFPLWLALLIGVYVSIVKSIWLRREVMRTACRTLLIGELSPLQMIEQYPGPAATRARRTGAEMAAALAAEEV